MTEAKLGHERVIAFGDGLTRDHIEVCDGVVRQREGFQYNACVPLGNWRPLPTNADATEVFGTRADAVGTDWVCLWRLPAQIQDFIRIVPDALKKRNKVQVAHNLFTHSTYRRGIAELIRLAKRAGAEMGMRTIGSYAGPVGKPSTSVGKDDLYVGLHIDSWNEPKTISARGEGFPTRLCVNVGPEDRYLQFVGRSAAQIQRVLGFAPTDDPTAFVRAYFDHKPDTEVFKITIPPGWAYITSTDILIHDGTTLGKTYVDAVFALLGHFSLDVLDRLTDPEFFDGIRPDTIRRYLGSTEALAI